MLWGGRKNSFLPKKGEEWGIVGKPSLYIISLKMLCDNRKDISYVLIVRYTVIIICLPILEKNI